MDGYKRIPTAAASLTDALALGRAFWQLTKPRVVALLVLTAWVGMMLAGEGLPDLALMAVASLGIAMVSGAAERERVGQAGRRRRNPLVAVHVDLP